MRVRKRSLLVALIAAMVLTPPLAAQDATMADLEAGDRVRTRIGGERVVGTFVSAEGPLRISTEGEVVAVPLSHDIEIERSLGPRSVLSGFANGAGLGFLAGAATGAVVGVASGDDTKGFIRFSAGEKAFGFGVVLGAGGAVLGGIIGAMAPGERWQEVELLIPAGAALFTTRDGGVGIAFELETR